MRKKISLLKRMSFSVFAISLATNASSFEDRSSWLVGKWLNLEEGQEIRIERDGAVFAQSAQFPLSGSAAPCISGGGNFCFEGKASNGQIYRCAYRIAFAQESSMINFRTTRESFVGCPQGAFIKSR